MAVQNHEITHLRVQEAGLVSGLLMMPESYSSSLHKLKMLYLEGVETANMKEILPFQFFFCCREKIFYP